jgi:hypothetical protein
LLPEHDGRQGFNGYMARSNRAQSLWSGAGGEVQDWLAVDWFATVRQLDLLAGMALSLDGVRVELASAIPVMCGTTVFAATVLWSLIALNSLA